MKYTVKPGETVLGIANRHNTTLDHLLSLNPGLQADYVQADQVINVPYVKGDAANTLASDATAKGKETTSKNITGTTSSHFGSNFSFAPKKEDVKPKITYKEYKVKKKDTPYSLAKANNITVDELMAANPSLQEGEGKLKKGTIIRIPVKTYPPQPQYTGLTTIRMAVILPFKGTGVENQRSIEFYRGLLLGIEDMKNKGANVILSAYNEPSAETSIAQTMSTVMAQQPNLIVGPLYPSHFTDVTAVSSATTRVFVPFSSKVSQVEYRPNVFVVNTPAAYENKLGIDLFTTTFKKDVHVILLNDLSGNKREFAQGLHQQLTTSGYDVEKVSANATASQIAAVLTGKTHGHYVLVPTSSTESALRHCTSVISSLRSLIPQSQFSLLGYDAWLSLTEGEWKKTVHTADTYILTSSYFYPYTSAAKAFRADYAKWFKDDLLSSSPRMAPLGYDLARTTIGSLATYGNDYHTQALPEETLPMQSKLQNDIRFTPVGASGGYINKGVWMVHFKPDMSIVKINN